MQFIDTHTHIYLPEFNHDRNEAVTRATDIGVTRLLMPNIDADSVAAMLYAEESYPGICVPMIGLHPTSVKQDYNVQLDRLEELFSRHRYIAIGETGIDLYWDKTFLKEQISALRRQVAFALEKDLPVIIHSRDSFHEVFTVLEEFRGSGIKGVFHAFSGRIADAEKAITLGFMLGIGGIVTFKNSDLGLVVKETGLKNIVLETDSPYLAPVPYRGKRNESSYLCIINKKIAEITGMNEEECAAIIYANSSRLFRI